MKATLIVAIEKTFTRKMYQRANNLKHIKLTITIKLVIYFFTLNQTVVGIASGAAISYDLRLRQVKLQFQDL